MGKKLEGLKVVGKSVEKVDALSLATGKPNFTDDIKLDGLLYAKILTSPYAHARIKNIDISEAEKMPGVHAVLYYGNVPRVPHTTAGQGYPEPSPYDTYMFDKKVRYVGDRVAAVAAESPEIAEEALTKIKVEYEVLEPVFDPKDALKPGAPIIHDEPDTKVIIPIHYEPERNLAAHVDTSVGDVEKGLAEADAVVELETYTQYAQHCPIEPHISIAWIDERGRIVIRTSTQVPFHVRRIVAQCLQIPVKKIRVIKPRIGGGFGTKQEILLEDIVAMFALRTKRPVKLEYTREEEFVSARTRHPAYTYVRIGGKKDGTLTAIEMKVTANTGAYGSHALTVPSNTGSKILPLYRCENVSFWADAAYTNLWVAGAYRGYGATQGYFAMETAIDELAEKLGIDPLEFRKKVHIREGESSPIFRALGEGREGVEQTIDSCGLDECIDIGAKEIGWFEKRNAPKGNGPIRRGVGMAILMQGSSIPEIDMGAASIKMNEDGSFNLLMGATDLGTGSDTVLSQIAAEELGVEVTDIIPYSSDTDMTPFDVGAYASSTTYLSGSAVKKAAAKVRDQILDVALKILELPPEMKEKLVIGNKKVVAPDGREVSYERIAYTALYELEQFQIGAVASHITKKSPPPFSAHFAEVEVDIETGFVRVIKYVAAVDCGTAINPKLAEGQTEGAVLNGISFALTEEYIRDERGRMLNTDFDTYKIFTAADLPEIKAILVPTVEPTGPYGAKSVSEIGINGPIPAIANAIYNAVGVRLRRAPFTPDRVLAALKQAGVR